MIAIMALLLFGVVLALGGATPELLAPSFFLGLLLAAVWAVRLALKSDSAIKRSPLHLPVLVFLAYSLVRYFYSPFEYDARNELFQIVLCVLVYFVCANQFRSPRHRTVLIFLLAGLAVFEGMYGLWQALTRSDAIFHWLRSEGYRGRASGTFICPNHLAGCLELILGLMAARLAFVKAEAATFERSMLIKVCLGYAVAVAATGIAFSQSRAGWISAAGGLVVLALWGRRFSARLLLRLALVGVIFGGAVALVLSTDSGWRRISETFKREGSTGELRLKDSTLGGRLVMWAGTLRMIRENPVFGTGPGTWQWLFQKHKDPRLVDQPEYTHNDYLNLASDYGIFGAVIVAWFFVAFFRHARMLGKAGQSEEQRAFAIGAASAVSAILIHSWFDFNLHIPANAVLLAAIVGTMTAMDDPLGRFPARVVGPGRFAVAAAVLAFAVVAGWCFVPTVASAHFADIGNGLRRRLEYDAALDYYRRAIAADSRAPQPRVNLGETYLVQASLRLGPAREESRRELALLAVEAFDDALRLNPYISAAWLGRGRAFEMAQQDAEVIESYRKAAEIDPVNPSVYFRLGCFYRDRGDLAKADEEFEKSNRLRGVQDSGALLNLLDIRNR